MEGGAVLVCIIVIVLVVYTLSGVEYTNITPTICFITIRGCFCVYNYLYTCSSVDAARE